MANVTFFYELKILEKHLDTFGHVNNAVYLQLFEEARWEAITSRGYGMAEVIASHQGPIILEIHLKMRKELRLREEITIETECTEYRKRIGKMVQRIRNTKSDVAAELEIVFGLFDTIARQLILPSPEWLHAIGMSKD